MAKPDNRADNVEHLQQHIQHTIQNLHEAEQYLDEHADEMNATEYAQINEKNQRREASIRSFRAEVKDEAKRSN
ncbi:Small, acid-soluble spore protein Tlp [compost metagenome]